MSNGQNYNALTGLAALLKKPEIQNAWYNNQEIKIDGYRFVSCRFDNCTIIATTANFELHNCFIDPSTQIRFGDEIAKPIRLFNSRYDWVYENLPFFAPMRNQNGTISI